MIAILESEKRLNLNTYPRVWLDELLICEIMNLYERKIENIIKRVGYPVAVESCWDDCPIYDFVRGHKSFLLLDICFSSREGEIHLYRHPSVSGETLHVKASSLLGFGRLARRMLADLGMIKASILVTRMYTNGFSRTKKFWVNRKRPPRRTTSLASPKARATSTAIQRR